MHPSPMEKNTKHGSVAKALDHYGMICIMVVDGNGDDHVYWLCGCRGTVLVIV